MTKICCGCKIDKCLEAFAIKKNGRFGRKSQCKECVNAKRAVNKDQENEKKRLAYLTDSEYAEEAKRRAKDYFYSHREEIAQYKRDRRDIINEQKRMAYPRHKEKIIEYQKQHRIKHGEKIKARRKELRLINLEKIREREREYSRNRRKNDIQYRIVGNLRNRIRLSLENKSECTKNLLGCSLDDFVKHLESQFAAEMNWGNYGEYWEIDHIKPCCSFDLSDVEQQKICFHWSNCRPLTVTENKRKSAEDKKSKRKVGNAA